MWGPLDELGDDIDLIDEINRLPKLNDIDDIPLSQLIEKLHQPKIVTMAPVQKRHRYVTFTLGGLMILLMTGVGAVGLVYWRYPGILINCFKKLKKRSLVFTTPASAQTSSGENTEVLALSETGRGPISLPDDWMVVHVCRRRPTIYNNNREIILTVYKLCSRGREC